MRKTYLALIIVLICIMLSPFVNDIIYIQCPKKRIQQKNITFKTGDLILSKWYDNDTISRNHTNGTILFHPSQIFRNVSHKLFSVLVSGYYTHIGLLMVLNNKPYIYEITSSKTYDPLLRYDALRRAYVSDEAALIDISYLNYYKGHTYHLSYIGPKITESKTIKVINKYSKFRGGVARSMIKCITNEKLDTRNVDSMSCTALISYILHDFGIVNIKHKHCSTPQSILNECFKSNKYSDTVKLIDNEKSKSL